MDLNELGWNQSFAQDLQTLHQESLVPARVLRADRQRYQVRGAAGQWTAVVTGRFAHQAQGPSDFPAIGDWVALQPAEPGQEAVIAALLPRQSAFSRLGVNPGGRGAERAQTDEQVIAANVDTAFLVNSLEGERGFELPRLERYLTLAWSSGANPVIVLNKTDACDRVEEFVAEAESIAFGVPVFPVSAAENQGIGPLRDQLAAGQTGVFLGPSGAGKSTLINALCGSERLPTGSVRGDDKRGRHTTTWSELITLPEGGMIIDTPGMRDIQLWADEEGLQTTFEDIEALAGQCRFADCSHQSEPNCAILAAIAAGELEEDRLKSYRKLQRELQFLADRQAEKGRRSAKEEFGRKLARHTRQLKKHHPKL